MYLPGKTPSAPSVTQVIYDLSGNADCLHDVLPLLINTMDDFQVRKNAGQCQGDQRYPLLRHEHGPDFPSDCWRGGEAGHLKVYAKGGEIPAVMGEGHQSLDRDPGEDFLGWFIAELKNFQLWHCLRQAHNDIVIHS